MKNSLHLPPPQLQKQQFKVFRKKTHTHTTTTTTKKQKKKTENNQQQQSVLKTSTKQTKQGKMKNPLHLFPPPPHQLQKQQFKVFRKKKHNNNTKKKKKKQKTTNNNSLFSPFKIDNTLFTSMQIPAHQTLGSSLLSSGSLSSPKAQPTAVSRHPNIPLAMTNIQSNSTGKDLKSDP